MKQDGLQFLGSAFMALPSKCGKPIEIRDRREVRMRDAPPISFLQDPIFR